MLGTSAKENIGEELEVPMVVTREDLAPVEFSSVEESEIKIHLNIEEKNIDHIVGEARGVNTEKRPGGYFIETWYPEELGGYQTILNENEEDANTLHIITDNEIVTMAGQKTEILLDVAEEIIKDIQ